MTVMYRCWWCGDRSDLEPHRLEGARLAGVLMTPPQRLTRAELDAIRLCWGCLERFAHFALKADAEYAAHVQTRDPGAARSIVIDLPTSVVDLLRQMGTFGDA